MEFGAEHSGTRKHLVSQPESCLNPSVLVAIKLHYMGMIKSLTIGDWFNLQPLLAPQRSGSKTKSFNSPITCLVLLATSSIFKCFPKVRCGGKGFVMNNKTSISLLRLWSHFRSWGQENNHSVYSEGFGSCEPRSVHKDQIYFFQITVLHFPRLYCS